MLPLFIKQNLREKHFLCSLPRHSRLVCAQKPEDETREEQANIILHCLKSWKPRPVARRGRSSAEVPAWGSLTNLPFQTREWIAADVRPRLESLSRRLTVCEDDARSKQRAKLTTQVIQSPGKPPPCSGTLLKLPIKPLNCLWTLQLLGNQYTATPRFA